MFKPAHYQLLELLRSTDADIYLQGAQLARFRDWLYLSPNSEFVEGKSLRGGVPVIFPWFGPNKTDPSAPQHGLARTALWQVGNVAEDAVTLDLKLDGWRAQMQYGFGDQLRMRLQVENTAPDAAPLECALHTYYAVSDVREISIEGLDGATYLDKTEDYARKMQSGDVTITGETDRVYLGAPGPIAIRDANRTLEIRGAAGWTSTVVWNPWSKNAARMKDLGADEWRNFVCVECGAIADDAVSLGAGETYVLDVSVSLAE